MKKWLVILIFICGVPSAFAQTIERKNVQFFLTNEEYHSAIQHLLKLEENGTGDIETKIQLAQAYYAQRDFKNALEWMEKANSLNTLSEKYQALYAELLKSNGKIAQADSVYKKLGKEYSHRLSDKTKSISPAPFDVFQVPNFNTSGDDFSPTFYRNGIVYVSHTQNKKSTYSRNQRPYLSIYHIPYKPTGLEKGSASEMKLPKVSKMNLGPVAFTRDDKMIYFTNNIKSGKKAKVSTLGIFSLKDREGKWMEMQAFDFNSAKYSVGHPTLNELGTEMYFVSDMPGGYGGTDIYFTRYSKGKWSTPINLGPAINTDKNEMFPFLHKDGTLYFASEGHSGFGGLDIFYTKYENGKWKAPTNMGQPVNSGFDDFGLVLDKDLKMGYLSSNRPNGKGNDDVYRVVSIYVREGAYKKISGIVKDAQSHEVLSNVDVGIYADGKLLQELKTDADGKFELAVNAQFSEVQIKSSSEGFFPSDIVLETKSLKDIPSQEIELHKIEINKSIVVPNIYFELDKADITPTAEQNLQKLFHLMNTHPTWIIEIAAHTDSRAETSYNKSLSEKRAANVVQFLQQKGISSSRLYSKGYGETKLLNRCKDGVECTEEEHAVNRRTEFKLIGFEIKAKDGDSTTPVLFADEYLKQKDLKYKIEVGVFSQSDQKWLQQLSDLGNVEIEDVETENFKKVYLSSYPTLEAADTFLKLVQERGMSNAFVVGYYKGKVISVSEAQKIQTPPIKSQPSKKSKK